MQGKRFIFLLVFLLSGCEKASETAQVKPVVEVTVQTLQPQSVELDSELNGRTTAAMVSDVRPQVDGIIQKRLFTEGSDVTAGQVLYQIDPASYQATYDEAAAALKNAQASVRAAKLKAERYARLVKEEGVSQQDADDAQTSYEEYLATVAEKQAALKTAQINLAYTQIKAPISGRIGISSVTPGALVTASQTTALATIRQLDPMYVDLTRSSRERLALLRLQKSEQPTVSLTLENGETYASQGKLQLSEVSVDESTGSVTLRAVFPNAEHILLPGMYVRASVANGTDPAAILAPQQGITRDVKGNATALVVNDQQQVEQREVVTARAIGNRWLVSAGLKAGDRLIIEGTNKVSVGDTVKAIETTSSSTGTNSQQATDQTEVNE
ncbi:efflux RND transporter periplasmic adaptor subunit [Brenneria goodwinii]|uniref:RND efflux system, membrane fusion protein CmeA n=1 Tax=Brenneria goodwinii TaxID=1109412 RepID=A0A0G4JXV2_9GAMM|nr:efflux RND transporter periplasmic adaptor subunit [Brenneria goodwinii]MCG8157627.1 efflux RND transporter periplasmic adaptor subunit [Brenneria goodwinii]MCG8161888.1 efflux RND transporter periplasmic adaptor subunit [Brenneria goodwinii]MCG8168351.1 efflux RND transporter periplasmic adaptor subunit [Brenneria goodwinii]MCG8172984.1 efflux RND transporter periplasmic adaptor subunit [Brenneria goodwinii]MCG8176226.1 efflux RND transporter periplasmic adaptor subunit [Brenneria goodwini